MNDDIDSQLNFSSRLGRAMQDAGFKSQGALARASRVPQPTVNRLLRGNGTQGPETATVRKLAAACNVTFDWLMHGRSNFSHSPKALTEREAEWLKLLEYLGSDDIAEFVVLIQARQARNKRLLTELCR